MRVNEIYKGYTDEQLMTLIANQAAGSIDADLGDRELELRRRLHRHQLDMNVMAEQVRWMKCLPVLCAGVTLGSAVIGALGGVLLMIWLQPLPSSSQPIEPKLKSQQQSEPSTLGDRKEKDDSVPSKPPTSK